MRDMQRFLSLYTSAEPTIPQADGTNEGVCGPPRQSVDSRDHMRPTNEQSAAGFGSRLFLAMHYAEFLWYRRID